MGIGRCLLKSIKLGHSLGGKGIQSPEQDEQEKDTNTSYIEFHQYVILKLQVEIEALEAKRAFNAIENDRKRKPTSSAGTMIISSHITSFGMKITLALPF